MRSGGFIFVLKFLIDYYQHIIIKFGGGTYVRSLRKIGVGLLVVTLAVGASMLGQFYMNTFAANTLPGNNEIITIGGTTDGQPPNATIDPQDYSGDGNVILFTSNATNLPDAGGTTSGLYVYNIKTNTTSRVDVSTSHTLPNGSVISIGGVNGFHLSDSGRYVTFISSATNLIDGVTKSQKMTYRHDVQTGETVYVGGGTSSNVYENIDRNLDVSSDGRFALLSSRYIANTYPYNFGIVLGDNTSGTYTWSSLGEGGYDSGYNDMTTGELSCDGAFAVFKKQYSIIVADLRNGTKVELTAGNSTSVSPKISCNGRYVLYATKNRTDITPTPSGMDSYLHLARYDRITGERLYVDSNSSGVFSTAQLQYNPTYSDQQPDVFNASISDTGDVVLNYKQSGSTYTYLKHLSDQSGTLESIAKTSGGTYINVLGGTITSNGRYVFFKADPYNLGLAPSATSAQLIRAKTGL